jgi:hypothetical protein
MNKAKIPQTDSIEELAHFWDTHDLTDFEDELEQVLAEAIFERREEVIVTIHLQPKEAATVKRIATSKGLEQTALVHQWVLEKIYEH